MTLDHNFVTKNIWSGFSCSHWFRSGSQYWLVFSLIRNSLMKFRIISFVTKMSDRVSLALIGLEEDHSFRNIYLDPQHDLRQYSRTVYWSWRHTSTWHTSAHHSHWTYQLLTAIIPTGRISCSPPSFPQDVSAARRHLKLIELNIEDLKKEVDRNNFFIIKWEICHPQADIIPFIASWLPSGCSYI